VTITIDATEKVTGSDRNFGTAPKTFHLQTSTDEQGRFSLAFQATAFSISFGTPGFPSLRQSFTSFDPEIGDRTNQNLKIFLDSN
jgi:hypothetical protein